MMFFAMFTPLVACIVCILFGNYKNIRDASVFFAAVLTFVFALFAVLGNAAAEFEFAYSMLAFHIEPLGSLFALLASFLWVVVHIYAIGYMRANNEHNQTRFFACFCFAIFATLGIAFSANLITMFLFYELLTLATYPLVAHKQSDLAKQSGRLYLGLVMGASVIFFLPAIVWTYTLTNGNLNFTTGGILQPFPFMWVLLLLFTFGLAKGAMMPLHRWLPAAMVAPTPVSALLHAVAVVKAGVFSLLKIGVYIFGIDTLQNSNAIFVLGIFAAVSIIVASIVAISKDDLKARLAYSTVSQLAYVALGLSCATVFGIVGAAFHILAHGFGKITLFMCAGNIYTAHHKQSIKQMVGLGRVMPFTFVAFAIGAVSIIGLPPLVGAWGKGLLFLGASNLPIFIVVLAISTLLNIFYLVPIFAKGFFVGDKKMKVKEVSLFCLVPPCITALGCLLLFIFAYDIVQFLLPIVEEQN